MSKGRIRNSGSGPQGTRSTKLHVSLVDLERIVPPARKGEGSHLVPVSRGNGAADRITTAELAQLQNQKLRDLIEYSFPHVPYVREHMLSEGFMPPDIGTPDDLRRLPLMRKADVRANREKLRSAIGEKFSSFTTGGSTGDPLIFDLAKRRVASRVACRQRTSRWWGVAVGDPEMAIWGSPVELTQQDWVRNPRSFSLEPSVQGVRNERAYDVEISGRDRARKMPADFRISQRALPVMPPRQDEGRNLRRWAFGWLLLPAKCCSRTSGR